MLLFGRFWTCCPCWMVFATHCLFPNNPPPLHTHELNMFNIPAERSVVFQQTCSKQLQCGMCWIMFNIDNTRAISLCCWLCCLCWELRQQHACIIPKHQHIQHFCSFKFFAQERLDTAEMLNMLNHGEDWPSERHLCLQNCWRCWMVLAPCSSTSPLSLSLSRFLFFSLILIYTNTRRNQQFLCFNDFLLMLLFVLQYEGLFCLFTHSSDNHGRMTCHWIFNITSIKQFWNNLICNPER